MSLYEDKLQFENNRKIYDSALLTFNGVNGFDVYNCSIPFSWKGETYIYGRVEKREEWATSWVYLFRQTGKDTYTVVKDSMVYALEDPYVQFFGDEIVMGCTMVLKEVGNLRNFLGAFYRGKDLNEMRYYTTGPDFMKDIRLVPLQDGRIGVFSRPRSEEIRQKYGSGAVVGFAVINDLSELTAVVIENAPAIGNLFGEGEWGGCNQCYLLRDGRIGVIGHKSCEHLDDDGVNVAVYANVAFVFDPNTHTATPPKIIATRSCYPDAEPKVVGLRDCAFTSGIVKREDGKVDLYSGVGDTFEGRVTIDNPFEGLY